jgi:hypothetical protein
MSTTEEEKAREEAEARRHRILETADDRLDIVTGAVIATTDADAGADATTDDADAAEEQAAKPRSAARLAAMRRRRFNKAKKEVTPVEEDEKNNEPAEAEPVAPTRETTTTTTTTTDKPSEKKYLGVAKMRRRKIKEKQLAQAAAQEGTSTSTSSAGTVVLKQKKKLLVDRLPILMHAVTVLLLFVAGLDVGIQQHHDFGEDIVIHNVYGPQQHGFKVVGAFHSKIEFVSNKISSFKMPKFGKTIEVDSEGEDVPVIDDEFAQGKIEEEEENLDPLFGIDLDKITEGPGLVNMMARPAIFMHRVNLKIFYYLPLMIVGRMKSMGMPLLNTPPIMCLAALTVRQLIGKTILGEKLPPKVTNEKKRTDIMSTAKTVITAFAISTFPILTNIYDAWTHLRSDMYVVLCGLFVGVIWNHFVTEQASLDQPVAGISDEL